MPAPATVLPVPPVLERTVTKPEVILPGCGVTFSETSEALFRAIAEESSPTVFQRGGLPVSLIVSAEDEPEVWAITPAGARTLLERFAVFKKYRRSRDDGLHLEDAVLDESTAKALLKAPHVREFLPLLRGLLRVPVLRVEDDALVRIESGYDPVSGLYVHDSPVIRTVSLCEAVEGIRSIFEEFDFQSEADRARAIAGLLSPFFRNSGFIDGPIPINIVESDQSQSGKGLFPQIYGAFYGEDCLTVPRRSGGVGSLDESLGAHFLKGGSAIHLDNVRGELRSEYLEAALTARGRFPVRIPYHGEIDIDVSAVTLYLSSNGFQSTLDLANRASLVRIRKREGHRYTDIPRRIREDRGFYLGCLIRIVEEYFRQGSPTTDESRHSFYHWSQPMDWVVQNFFGLPPLLEGHDAALTTISDPGLGFLRALAIAVEQDERLDQPLSASNLADICHSHDIRITGSRPNHDIGESTAAQTIGCRLKPVFREADTVVIDRYEVSRRRRVVDAVNSFRQWVYQFRYADGG